MSIFFTVRIEIHRDFVVTFPFDCGAAKESKIVCKHKFKIRTRIFETREAGCNQNQ